MGIKVVLTRTAECTWISLGLIVIECTGISRSSERMLEPLTQSFAKRILRQPMLCHNYICDQQWHANPPISCLGNGATTFEITIAYTLLYSLPSASLSAVQMHDNTKVISSHELSFASVIGPFSANHNHLILLGALSYGTLLVGSGPSDYNLNSVLATWNQFPFFILSVRRQSAFSDSFFETSELTICSTLNRNPNNRQHRRLISSIRVLFSDGGPKMDDTRLTQVTRCLCVPVGVMCCVLPTCALCNVVVHLHFLFFILFFGGNIRPSSS